jgi:hypothetical protein
MPERNYLTTMRRCLLALAFACQAQGSAPPSVTAEPSRLPPPAAAGPSTNASDPEAAPGRALELAGQPLHPGCIFELTQQVNGDLVAHSIYGAIDGARGCNRSNRYHQSAYWERGTLWFNQAEAGDRFGYQLTRAIDPQTYLLQTYVHTSGTYASTEFLLVRVDSLLETAIDDAHEPVQRKATLVTRLGEAPSEADAELLVAAVRKLAPAARP